MSYPTLEQYNQALQHPETALLDPGLRNGLISKTGLGLPLALCGGFALTYTVKTAGAKYAVRCFHKQTKTLEQRYSSISDRLNAMKSGYFVNFEFQPRGVRVNGKEFPIVKMEWASGDTLGEFLEVQYGNKRALQQLNSSLGALADYMKGQDIAHGDVQPGNVMVSSGGNTVQLIDYDGMFVVELSSLGSAEFGHRNFQHPQRTTGSWNSRLDRFSFISLNLALRVLQSHPDLWGKTQSDGDSVLFKANDFADPAQSNIFSDLIRRPQFAEDAINFAAICKDSFDRIPTLEDFLARRNIHKEGIELSTTASIGPTQYISAFPALDSTNYTLCLSHVGDRVELIGRIVEIKEGTTRYGKPYIFINFGPWRGEIVKITIWAEGLSALSQRPDQSWIGNWISVVGLIEPPYRNPKYKYSHLAISITQANQLHVITHTEAKFRLAGTSTRQTGSKFQGSNRDILGEIYENKSNLSRGPFRVQVPVSQNQTVLDAMKGSRQKPATQSQNRSQQPPSLVVSGKPAIQSQPQLAKSTFALESQEPAIQTQPRSPGAISSAEPKKQKKAKSDCFIATAVFGADALETNALRAWRDTNLMPSTVGRVLVNIYYKLSPCIVPLLKRNNRIACIVRKALKKFISAKARL